MKSDGSYTYFASDIAYHQSKFDRGFTDLIDVWGADHGGYVKRMQAAVKAVSGGKAALDVKLVQLVRLLRAGEPVKMSKRAGDFVTLREVVDEVGRDAIRFMMLYRKNDAVLDFDLAKVIEQSRTTRSSTCSTAMPAVSRSSAMRARPICRICRRRRGAARCWRGRLEQLDRRGRICVDAADRAVIRGSEAAAAAHEPHRVAFYLMNLQANSMPLDAGKRLASFTLHYPE